MNIPLLTGAAKAFGLDKVVEKAANKAFGETPQEKLEAFKAEMAHELEEARIENDRASAFEKFMLGWEGSAAEQHPVVRFARGILRPVCLFLGIVLTFIGHFTGSPIPVTSLAGLVVLSLLASWLNSKRIADFKGKG